MIIEPFQVISNSGFYYYNARWYDPETARFITEAPIKDGMLWHAYCYNNPINYKDPTGLSAEDAETSDDLYDSMVYGTTVYYLEPDEDRPTNEGNPTTEEIVEHCAAPEGNTDSGNSSSTSTSVTTSNYSSSSYVSEEQKLQNIIDSLESNSFRYLDSFIGENILNSGDKITAYISHELIYDKNILTYNLQAYDYMSRNGNPLNDTRLTGFEDFRSIINITIYSQSGLNIIEQNYSYNYIPGVYYNSLIHFSRELNVKETFIGAVASVDYYSRFTSNPWKNHESLGDISEY